MTADSVEGTISVRFGDGAGGFGDRISLPTADQPLGIVAADFDDDGIEDLAVAQVHAVGVFLSDGSGGFKRRAEFASLYPLSAFPTSVCAADFRVDYDHDTVDVLLGLLQAPTGWIRLSGGAAATARLARRARAGAVSRSGDHVLRYAATDNAGNQTALHTAPQRRAGGNRLVER